MSSLPASRPATRGPRAEECRAGPHSALEVESCRLARTGHSNLRPGSVEIESESREFRLHEHSGTEPMPARNRIARSWWLAAILGTAALAFAQQPADSPSPATQPDPAAANPAPPDPELATQVQQLQAEVDQLKAQVAQLNALVEQLQNERAAAPAAAAPPEKGASKKAAPKKANASAASKAPAPPAGAGAAAEETSPTTVLVFHDGHRTEARNYAIVGQTLWIYTQDQSQKVPLSELDVAATKSANSDRGIIFQMPPSR